MKYIKIFEAFKSKWIGKFFNDPNFKDFIKNLKHTYDIKISEIKDLEGDTEVIKFMSAIDGYNYKIDSNEVRVKCEECDGTGKTTCSECGGDYNQECPVCNGSGVDSYDDSCEECDGDGEVVCKYCNSGKANCDECDGSGEVKQSNKSKEKNSYVNDLSEEEDESDEVEYDKDSIIKAFFDEDKGLSFLLDKNNYLISKSPYVRYSGKSFFRNDSITSRYDDHISKDKVIRSADYCIIIQYSLLKNKYSGKDALKKQRKERREDALALKDNSYIRQENIDRYENILFAKYGFDSDLENFKKGVVIFNQKILNRVPPIMILYYRYKFIQLFSSIKRNLLNLEYGNEQEEYYKSEIKDNLKSLFKDIRSSEYPKDDQIDQKLDEYAYSHDMTFFKNSCWPFIQNFNREFKIEAGKINDISDVVKYCDNFLYLERMIDDINFSFSIIGNLYRRGLDGISRIQYELPSNEYSKKKYAKNLEIVTKTAIKIFK